jgi:hypothetical protein
MRAVEILHGQLESGGRFLHAKQWSAIWRAVAGLVRGRQLWLTGLGRSLPGASTDKHRIKAVDRLLGSAGVQRGLLQLYAVLARFLLRRIPRPIILVDWTGGAPGFYILSAMLCFEGRAIPIYSRTFFSKRKCSPRAEREFLADLVEVVPSGCVPILVTDAGFHLEWFDAVRERGWEFVGRVRGKLTVQFEGAWAPLSVVHARARQKPRDLGMLALRHKNSRQIRLVLAARRKLKGRKQYRVNGQLRTGYEQARKSAREPWLLATSLNDSGKCVVDVYAMRMQIEQTFRDLKNHRYGWSFRDMRCKTTRRSDVLLLVAALAMVVMHTVGLAAGQTELARGFQANTVRDRRVFSTFSLAKLLFGGFLETLLPAQALRASLCDLQRRIALASTIQE